MAVPQEKDGQGAVAAVTVVEESNSADVPNLKGDWHNIFVLILLYIIQGIGTSVYIGVPIILQGNKNVTYKDQAFLSMVAWPNSLRIILAPLVDALYIQKVGRRKSWLIPVYFFNRNNVGYGPTCSLIGVPFGATFGSFILVEFTSENFCNKYLRFSPDTGGIVSLPGFFYSCGFLFILISILIGIFKKEKHNRLEDNHMKLNIIQYYIILWKVLKLPSIRVLPIALLTEKIGFASSAITVWILQLIDAGVPKDNVMLINSSMIIVKVITPIIISKYTAGPKTMSIYLIMSPIRLMWNITFVIFIYYTTKFITNNGKIGFPMYFYAILVFLFIMNNILNTTMRLARHSLFSRISDPRFGGIYMALLNTFSSMGVSLSTSLAISLIDFLTLKACLLNYNNNCSTTSPKITCKTNGSSCFVLVNGYYVESVLCILFGIGWYYIFSGTFKSAQVKSSSHWMVNMKNNTVKNNETIENNG